MLDFRALDVKSGGLDGVLEGQRRLINQMEKERTRCHWVDIEVLKESRPRLGGNKREL